MKRIYLGADHAGFKLKENVKSWLKKKKILFTDLGNLVFDKDDDYPDFAEKVAKMTVKEKTFGALFCGSAEGMCIAANKIKGIKAVNPSTLVLTRLSRKHNNANILCLSGLYTKPIQAHKLIETFLKTKFSKEKRHLRRLKKIAKMER
jgi:ribose 5-phosphate isomerase B